ncbi:hypothetical protein PUH89_05410 [Rhodobacter capsulatus]|uniref:Uncharacterized protein n=1 Tax=Rhodobacter capsulatus TaxID=1061 RepID=A0A1G7SM70_RHOCA|nr:hypothetical protein [Rhodobacter capsulatus]WER10425.1 hypothetical protein PUH89_05410 [Rhodobacter capsulatus]SDG24156.1 hypothetical protein SAMN04244550_03644 [Rhodobacter capsulatus]
MNAPLPNPPVIPTFTTGDWMHDRLTEARGVLADTTQHPDSLVILAARVVVGLTDDARECGDALEVLRLLDRRPLHAIAAAAFPNGGAA